MSKYKRYILSVLIILFFIVNLKLDDAYMSTEEGLAYKSIESIYIYGEKRLLKDDIKIGERPAGKVLGGKKYLYATGDEEKVIAYYRNELKNDGWVYAGYEKIKSSSGYHCGDQFVFKKDKYKIRIKIEPPLKENWDANSISLVMPNQKPFYWIYVGTDNYK